MAEVASPAENHSSSPTCGSTQTIRDLFWRSNAPSAPFGLPSPILEPARLSTAIGASIPRVEHRGARIFVHGHLFLVRFGFHHFLASVAAPRQVRDFLPDFLVKGDLKAALTPRTDDIERWVVLWWFVNIHCPSCSTLVALLMPKACPTVRLRFEFMADSLDHEDESAKKIGSSAATMPSSVKKLEQFERR